MWNQSRVNIKILESTIHCIHGIVNEGSIDEWVFTVVYANPNITLKQQCFEKVAQLARNIRTPWMVIGDFNEILLASEKVGGAPVDHRRIAWFAE